MMGYKTPNIDRIAKQGALFTDWYGQQSCTAGRASFITGQVGYRTGMLKVGMPGAAEGLKARDVTIAELLKGQGYMIACSGAVVTLCELCADFSGNCLKPSKANQSTPTVRPNRS